MTPVFAPLPARAISDKRLHGLHLRAIAAIAIHDRLSTSRGTAGCWAGNKRLAEMLRCHLTNLSTALSELVRWEYLSREVDPANGRQRVYRVIYAKADALLISKRSRDSLPKEGGIVCPAESQVPESTGELGPNRIEEIKKELGWLVEVDTEAWYAWDKHLRETTGQGSPMSSRENGWRFPSQFPPGYQPQEAAA